MKLAKMLNTVVKSNVQLYCEGAFKRHPNLPEPVRTAMGKCKTKMAAKRLLKAQLGSVLF